MTVGITGARSTIAQAFINMVGEDVYASTIHAMRLDLPRYLICTGFLAGKRLADQKQQTLDQTWRLNFTDVARFCDRLFDRNVGARVVVIGSESGINGSYDMAYAGAKAALHRYVETKCLDHPDQMLIALAPHVIWDSGMTQRRDDLSDLEERGKANRLGRWLTAREVAAEAVHLLYKASPSLSGQVIRMRSS